MLQRYAGRAADLALRLLERARPPRLSFPEYRNFLLLHFPVAIGSALHVTPLLHALKAVVPGAQIRAVSDGTNHLVLAGNPHLDGVVTLPDPLHHFREAVGQMRREAPFAGEPYIALQPAGTGRKHYAFAALLGGADACIDLGQRQCRTTVVYDDRLSRIANHLRMIELLGHGPALAEALLARPELQEPQIFPSAQHAASVEALLQRHGVAEGESIAILVLHGSEFNRTRWPLASFAEVARWLHAEQSMRVVLTGTAGDAAAIDAFCASTNVAAVNLAGKTDLLEFAALCQRATVGVMVDTGSMHVARAVRLPTVVIAPSSISPVMWLPFGVPHMRVHLSSAAVRSGGQPAYDARGEVPVSAVKQSVQDLLQMGPR